MALESPYPECSLDSDWFRFGRDAEGCVVVRQRLLPLPFFSSSWPLPLGLFLFAGLFFVVVVLENIPQNQKCPFIIQTELNLM